MCQKPTGGHARADPNTEAIEDYAKAIYALSREREGPVLNGEVAERLGVTPATATSMLKRLDDLGLVELHALQGRRPDRRRGRRSRSR